MENEKNLLALDIGNTNIVCGLFEGQKLLGECRLETIPPRTYDEYATLLSDFLSSLKMAFSDISDVILSSVVPERTPILQQFTEKYISSRAMVVSHLTRTGLKIQCRRPEEVGADRIVNAAAAYALYGGPVVIVDFGTATTFCVVSKEGGYAGGVIAPGLSLSAEALFSNAAKLPRVVLKKPDEVIGKETVSSMQSGIVFGHIGLVNEILIRIHDEIGKKMRVVATGGLAGLIASECPLISELRPTLTLEGLMIIYRMNR
ncbi:MAG: type III pantothenate kinase [Nitrospira sp.]|nr:type III pantothenate kinase [Candidatus Manganitrophaceae bacterium]HIL35028.1 type III pantothenate kinase [Candidatus Manganitrophaceae bacterium]